MIQNISSRKNSIVKHFREISSDRDYRKEKKEFLCDGAKLLKEAIGSGAKVKTVLFAGEAPENVPEGTEMYCCPMDIIEYVSPLKKSVGPLFTVEMDEEKKQAASEGILILENVQDPGNVGTVLRTSNAMGVGTVILTGDCADVYNPKAVRATMGAIFRQKVLYMGLEEMKAYVSEKGLKLYGAALSDTARDIRDVEIEKAAVAIGSEGKGLSKEILELCDGCLIIPMEPGSESLNAGVAASIVAWEMKRRR